MSHWNNPGDTDRRWATELHNAFQGSARVNLSLIEIGPEWQLNNENVDALSRVFEKKGVYPLQRENHVEVKVSRANLERALRESGVTADELRQSEPASFPELKFAGVQLDCLHGKHRVQAARRMLPPFRWWIVDIYLDNISDELRRAQAEKYQHEISKPVGEIYMNLRHSEAKRDAVAVARWRAQLSDCVLERINMLESYNDLQVAFDSLIDVPAVMSSGAILSVWNKRLADRCFNEFIHYLNHIREFWAILICQGDRSNMKKITCGDIEALEGLAPGVSLTDRARVKRAVLNGEILQNFSTSKRNSIWKKVKYYKHRIPSLTLFFQDALFLGIAATRVKKLLDPLGRKPHRKRQWRKERDLSVRDRLGIIFYGQSNGEVTIQTGDDAERLVVADHQQQFDIAYRQLWLCAWRLSCGTPGEGNRPAELWSWTEPNAEYQLALCASRLGFRSDRIEKTLSDYSHHAPQSWYDFVDDRVPKLKRCGIPYTITFQKDRKMLYLDQLHAAPKECKQLSSAFILRDIYIMFFGELTISALNANQPSPGDNQASPSCFESSETSDGSDRPAEGDVQSNTEENTERPGENNSEDNIQSNTGDDTERPGEDNSENDVQSNTGDDTERPGEDNSEDDVQSNTGDDTERPGENNSEGNSRSDADHSQDTSYSSDVPSFRSGASSPATSSVNREKEDCSMPGSTHNPPSKASSNAEDMLTKLQALRENNKKQATKMHEHGLIIERQKHDIDEFIRSDDSAPIPLFGSARKELERCKALVDKWQTDHKIEESRISITISTIDDCLNGYVGEQNWTEGPLSHALPKIQNTYDSILKEYYLREDFLSELEAQRPMIEYNIRQFRFLLLLFKVGNIQNEMMAIREKIDKLEKTLTSLDRVHAATNPRGSPDEAGIQRLQDIKTALDTIYVPIKEQLKDLRKDLDNNICNHETWIMTLEELKKRGCTEVSKAQDDIQLIERQLQIQYTADLARRVERLQDRLKAGQPLLDKVESSLQSCERNLDRFKHMVGGNLELLPQFDQEHLKSLDTFIANLIGNLRDYSASYLEAKNANIESKKTLEQYISAVQAPLELTKQSSVIEGCNKIEQHIEKIQAEFKQAMVKSKNEIGRRYRENNSMLLKLADELLFRARGGLTRALEQSSRTNTATSLDMAKVAAKSAEIASDETRRIADIVELLCYLVEEMEAPEELRGHINRIKTETELAAKDARVAAANAVKSREQWENIPEKLHSLLESIQKSATDAKAIDATYRSLQSPGPKKTQSSMETLRRLALSSHKKNVELQKDIQRIAENSKPSSPDNLSWPIQAIYKGSAEASEQTANLAFDLHTFISERTASFFSQDAASLPELQAQAEKAIKACDKQGWEGAVEDAQRKLKGISGYKAEAKYVRTATTRLKERLVHLGTDEPLNQKMNQSVETVNKNFDLVSGSYIAANSILEAMQVGWSKGEAATEYTCACRVFGQAKAIVENVSLKQRFTKEVQSIKKDLQEAEMLFQSTEIKWQGCKGPAHQFELIAGEFKIAREKAMAVETSANQVLKLLHEETKAPAGRVHEMDENDESGGTTGETLGDTALPKEKEADEGIKDLVRRAEEIASRAREVQTEFMVATSGAGIDTTKGGEMVDEAQDLVVEIYSIYHEIRSQQGHPGMLGKVMETSLNVTEIFVVLLCSVGKEMAIRSQSYWTMLGTQARLTFEAAEGDSKELWEESKNYARDIVNLCENCAGLAEKASCAAQNINDSFNNYELSGPLTEGTMHAFSEMYKWANDLREQQTETGLLMEAISIGWWKEKANKQCRRAEKALSKAATAVDHMECGDGFEQEHRLARTAYRIAEDSCKMATQELLKCKGGKEDFDKIAEEFELAYQKAMAAAKSAEAVREKQRRNATLAGQKRRRHSPTMQHPQKFISPDEIHIFIMDGTNRWRLQSFPIPGYSETKKSEQELVKMGEMLLQSGRLYALNWNMTRLGTKCIDGFTTSVQSGQNVFFLEDPNSPKQLSSMTILYRATQHYKKYFPGKKVFPGVPKSQENIARE
ncbi:hypothetical protein RU639_013617 [Aspergillus parasiticus]